MENEEFVNPITEYNCGYYACEVGNPFDETKNKDWKEGYHDKEKERLVRSVKYHLCRVNGTIRDCHYLMQNKNGSVETHCWYYGDKDGNLKCYDVMLKDFLRLYIDPK